MTRSYGLLNIENSTFQSFDSADWRIWFYLVAQLVGGALMSLLLATMLWPTAKRRPRNPLLVSLCFSWWLSPFPSLLILYYAREVTGPPPTHDVCLASAVLTMSQSILVALTAPALIFHIWLVVQTALGTKFTSDGLIRRSTAICLIVPWTLYVVFTLTNLVVGLAKPALVHRALFYCIVDDDRLTEAIGVVGTVFMLAAIILEVWTVVLLHQNRARIHQLSRDGRGFDVSLVVRVIIFGIYVFLGLCLNVLSIIDWTNPIPDMFFSTFGIAVFAVFGTQRDIWRIWKDASRHVTSRRSGPNHSSHHSGTHNYPGLSLTGHPAMDHTSRHSARYMDYLPQETSRDSKHHSLWTIKDSATRSLPPSVPLPAALRLSSRQPGPALTIHSTPDLLHSGPSTPTTYNSPTHDFGSPAHDLWHPIPLRSDADLRTSSQRSLISATPAASSLLCPEHSYPPSAAWAAESAATLDGPPLVVRGDSPVVWDPDPGPGEDGARVWTAL